MNEFEWDERKNEANRAKHGLDFVDAVALFDHPHLLAAARMTGGETRSLATGLVDGRVVTAVFTLRGDRIRIISLRVARADERLRYQALLG
jgi:uncharacterized DUF497 family protein